MFHAVKPFKCNRCGSAFSHEKTLKQHLKIKKCCGQWFSNPALLEKHMKLHGISKNHSCTICLQTFFTLSELERHKWHTKDLKDLAISTTGESDEDDPNCSDSNSDAAPYFPCHVCGKTFPTSESLEDHQLCHLGEKPHECSECGKCFFQASQLQQHQRMHKSDRPHRCSNCQCELHKTKIFVFVFPES
uniref:C2H2-type domain-containing protein n=1 Tax=Oryzias latipes TaxID=8090 RepID=A0A3B3H556_ORYLA